MTVRSSDKRPRIREIGLKIGRLPTGVYNGITDVAGVTVGHITVEFGTGSLVPGQGPARTGVTVILPHDGNLFLDRVPAAIHVFNGFGKCMGIEQVEELGVLETPIALTSTLCVGKVADALVTHAIQHNPGIGIAMSTVNPFVGECSDAYLNDMQGRHVGERDVLQAIATASGGEVAEGSIGAGTGMSAFGFKGGIGTSSRVLPDNLGGWTVGVLVLANFGQLRDLLIDGVAVGELLATEHQTVSERGSIMMIVATDAPMQDRQLRRLARRAILGLARTGARGGHGSGDVVVAFSTAISARIPYRANGLTLTTSMIAEQGPDGSTDAIDTLFRGVEEATEEAILNALFKASTVVGRDHHIREAIPIDAVTSILKSAGRLAVMP